MTVFCSIAVFRRDGRPTYRHPRKEGFDNETQARKAASRYWNGNIQEPDRLLKIALVSVDRGIVRVAERMANASRDRPWVVTRMQLAEAAAQPHLAACLNELGVDLDALPPAMPDVLEINGVVYRREI